MATQYDFNAEQWRAITAAPVAAGLLVTLADISGPFGVAKEAMALSDAIRKSAGSSSSEIVKSIGQWTEDAGRLDAPRNLPRDKSALKETLLGRVQEGVSAVAGRSPGEMEEFKRFIMEVAKRTAAAAKEGGFLGFGGVEVSESEKNALAELSTTLGAPA
jgi:hypothetical protein